MPSAIDERYAELGGEEGILGRPLGREGDAERGRFRDYEHGSIYWSTLTGAHWLGGPILEKWKRFGAETRAGTLGYPTGDEAGVVVWPFPGPTTGTQRLGTRWCYFERGAIYWSAMREPVELHGPVFEKWVSLGGPGGLLGYPGSDVLGPGGAGVRFADVTFDRGEIVWSPETGAHELHGPIRDKFLLLGGFNGVLGYPASDVSADSHGEYAEFSNDALVYSSSSGTWLIRGPILAWWRAHDTDNGQLGVPWSDPHYVVSGNAISGMRQHFEAGSAFWSEHSGAHVLFPLDFRIKFETLGGPGGVLGYPTTDTDLGPLAGLYNDFDNGSIYSSGQTQAHDVLNPIRDFWLAHGGAGLEFGYPTDDTLFWPDGKLSSRFERGWIFSLPAGMRYLLEPIASAYDSLDGPRGVLGFPVTDTAPGPGQGLYNDFEKGSIYWSPTLQAHDVLNPIRDFWIGHGGAAGQLGYPTSNTEAWGTNGLVNYFEHGMSITWQPGEQPMISAPTPLPPSGLTPNGGRTPARPTLAWSDPGAGQPQAATDFLLDIAVGGVGESASAARAPYTLPTDLPFSADVVWKVRGRNQFGLGDWSQASFKVEDQAAIGTSRISIYNCNTDKRAVNVWLLDPSAQVRDFGSIEPQYDAYGICPADNSTPLDLDLESGHSYQVVVVDPGLQSCNGQNDPTNVDCQRLITNAIQGDANGPGQTITVS